MARGDVSTPGYFLCEAHFGTAARKAEVVDEAPHECDTATVFALAGLKIGGIGQVWRKASTGIADCDDDFVVAGGHRAVYPAGSLSFASMNGGIRERLLQSNQEIQAMFVAHRLMFQATHDLVAGRSNRSNISGEDKFDVAGLRVSRNHAASMKSFLPASHGDSRTEG